MFQRSFLCFKTFIAYSQNLVAAVHNFIFSRAPKPIVPILCRSALYNRQYRDTHENSRHNSLVSADKHLSVCFGTRHSEVPTLSQEEGSLGDVGPVTYPAIWLNETCLKCRSRQGQETSRKSMVEHNREDDPSQKRGHGRAKPYVAFSAHDN